MLKEALSSIKHSREKHYLKEVRKHSAMNTLENSRLDLMKEDREERQALRKQRKKEEKREYSMSLHEKREDSLERAKMSHDKVLEEAENIHIKKNYFDSLKVGEVKKREHELKHSLLSKIMSNTEKLKELKG